MRERSGGPPPARAAAGPGIPPFVKHLGGFMAGVGIVLGLVGLNAVGMRSAGRTLDESWKRNMGPPGPDAALQRTPGRDGSLDAVHQSCKRHGERARLDLSLATQARMPDGVLAMEAQIVRSGAFLVCLASERPRRFCEPTHRAHLAGAVRDHLALVVLARDERALSAGAGTHAGVGAALDGSGRRSGARPPLPSDALDPRILPALRGLAADGFLRPDDFATGWFGSGVPDVIRSALDGVAARAEPCRA